VQPIIFIGGVGSQTETIAPVLAALQAHYKCPVTGFTFRQAQNEHPDLRGSRVITHSAGMLLVRGHTPVSLLAIAPPVTMTLVSLLIKFVQKDRQLVASRRSSSPKRAELIKKFYRHAALEDSLHPVKNIFMAPKISRFDSLKEAELLAEKGVAVTLGFCAYDFLFRPEAEQVTRLNDVVIVSDLPGQHDELLLEPERVLERVYGF
jgi:hypothetical protein